MREDAKSLLRRTLELACELIDADRVATAKRRQADMFAWRRSDYVPITFGAEVEALRHLPDFDWARQFAEPAVSLYMQMKDVIRASVGGSDYVPTVRADTGVINGPSILGAPFKVPAHTKPVISGHISKDRLAAFEVPDDIRGLGVIPTMVEHTQHHLAALAEAGLADRVGVRHCDTQGPFDIAAQAYGHDEIFLGLYVDGDFVHELMAKCTDIYITLSRLSKQLAGHPIGQGYANEYWMDPGSVRLCDDSGILVSAEQYAEFLAPYLGKAFEPFGGGWIHYCGGIPDGNRPEGLHLHELYCAVPNMRGLNFTTGKDWPAEIGKVIASKVVYLGGLPRGEDEPLDGYFRRVLSLCDGRRGMIFSASVRPDELPAAMGTWHRLQDELWPN
ncbi:MAG TPA: hypothetical protein VM098_07820 [Phycisphaerae bacterium]|nr:hypothetical protein [Phycisphaerae bacterium]